MMRKARILFMAATAMTLAACSGDEHESGVPTDAEGNLIAARFSAGIGEAVPVRASGTKWAVDDKIGISATGNTAMAEKYQNVEYTVNSDGALEGETIYFQNMDEVTFNAYYPYTDTDNMKNGVISHTITASDQTSSNQPNIDYLFATATTKYASPSISLNFKHKMSKIEVDLTHDASISDDDFKKIKEYTIGGLVHEGTFDTADGTATTTGTAKDLTLGFSTTSIIVYPQTTDGFTISLTMDGNTYQCSLGKVTFDAGNSYAYTVTVKRTGLEVETAKINTWTNDGTATEGTATIPIGDKLATEAAVGDYYMSDGSLADTASTLTDEQKEACIGIVFALASDAGDYDESEYPDGMTLHGYVVALKDANGDCRWGKDGTILDNISSYLSNNSNNNDDVAKQYEWSGYKYTLVMKNKAKEYGYEWTTAPSTTNNDGYPAAYYAMHYGVDAPASSSGWFLPAAGQLKVAINAIKSGGSLYNNLTAVDGTAPPLTNQTYYWSSSERSDNKDYGALGVGFRNSYSEYKVTDGGKTYGTMRVRSVLAF